MSLSMRKKLRRKPSSFRASPADTGRVLLIAMPFASLNHPVIGLSLLQGALRRTGIAADIRHLYLDFAQFVGVDTYDAINDDRYFLALAGEWVFEWIANGRTRGGGDLNYVTSVLLGDYRAVLDAKRIMLILEARARAMSFIEYCIQSIPWQKYDAVGLSSSFQQSMASLALAKYVKEHHPEKLIVLGGANCEGEMGAEIHRKYNFIDVIIGGEAEQTFPELVRRYLGGETILGLPGTTIRVNGETVLPERASQPLQDLDQLPELDYSDFYGDRSRAPAVMERYSAVPLFESARGCWWGQKHHCTFCGLNALGMSYRSKSQPRAYDELLSIAGRYGREILVVDNILDNRYFGDFLPKIAATDPPLLMHYEVKANLKSSQLALLAGAGVRKIQPGIESLSTNVLQLMRKGTTMLRNVQTLKLAAEAGIYVEWGHLYGFPGETEEDYVRILNLLPLLSHLSPPSGVTRVRADRFSPYFDHPDWFGISHNPLPAYRYIYPFPSDSIRRLAYHFDIELAGDQLPASLYDRLDGALQAWSDRAGDTALWFTCTENGAGVVHDCRDGSRERSVTLDPCQVRGLTYAAEIHGIQQLRDELSLGFNRSWASGTIDSLLEQGFLLREADQVLALPLRQPGFKRAPLKDEIRTSLHRSYFFQAKDSDRNLTVAA